MRFLVSGVKPVFVGRSSGVRAAVAVCLLPLAGCASGTPSATTAQMAVAGPPVRVAAAPSVEIEDDGLPAQTPPRVQRHRFADDPNEPFSRNYGQPHAAPSAVPLPDTGKPDNGIQSADQDVPLQSAAVRLPLFPSNGPEHDAKRQIATLVKYE